MSKQLKTSLEARNAMKKGMDTLANIVKVTLGPKGRSVVIEKNFGEADIIQDGVNVARSIDLKNRFENMGASQLKSRNGMAPIRSLCCAPPTVVYWQLFGPIFLDVLRAGHWTITKG